MDEHGWWMDRWMDRENLKMSLHNQWTQVNMVNKQNNEVTHKQTVKEENFFYPQVHFLGPCKLDG